MKLKHKIIVLNMGTLLALLIVLGTVITLITDNYNLSNTLKYLQGQSSYASIYIEQYAMGKSNSVFDVTSSMSTYSPYLAAVLKDTVRCRVQIYYGSNLLGDSDEGLGKTTEISPEIAVTYGGKSAYFIRKTLAGRVFYYAFPISISNRYSYSIAFIYPLTEADSMMANVINIFIMTAFFLSIVILSVSTLISKRITLPVETLSNIARKFSKGDLKARVEASGKDEISELSTTFNQMADSLEDMIRRSDYEKEKQKHFFDNFTHEIRTPLTAIIGYSDLLWKTDNAELRDKSIFYINSEAQRMVKMTERLLELSKLKNYDFVVQKRDVLLRALIEDACDAISYKAKKKNIKFRLDLEDFVHLLDPDLIKQVVLNIIDNSIKYSGTKYIDISLRKLSGTAVITIKDEGKGISAEDKSKIFDPYFKGDKSRNSGTEGWGLGLSIVREIIDKHLGKITIDSEENVGTETRIELP